MKSEVFVIVSLIVALLILIDAIVRLSSPIVKYYYTQYKHHRLIQERRKRFYKELGILMKA